MKAKSILRGKKRYLVAAAVAVALAGGTFAFASSLSVTSHTLGAGTAAVTNSCSLSTSSGVTFSNTTPGQGSDSGTDNVYWVTSITITGASAACDSLFYRLDAANATGGSIHEFTGQLAATGNGTITISPIAVGVIDAANLANITAVVESGSQP